MKRLGLTVGVAVGLIVTLVLTLIAFRLPVGSSLQLILQGAFGDKIAIARTVVKATPLLLTSLGMVVAWRAGMYNIGGEGQYIIGGLFGGWAAKALLSFPPPVLNVAILMATMVGGALFAWIAGWLYVRRGVQVVISTILLNFVALQTLDWAVHGPLQEAKRQLPISDKLPNAVMLQHFDPRTDLHSGVFIAVAIALLVWLLLYLTPAGFRIRLVGASASAARASGQSVGKIQIQAMLLSGALCGLAGGVEFTGMTGQLGTGFSQSWGFLGIPVALLGGLHPVGVIFSSLYFGSLFAGSENLARFTDAGSTLVYVIQAVAVLAFVGLTAYLKSRPAPIVEEEPA